VALDVIDVAHSDFVPDLWTELGFAVHESVAVLLLASSQFGDDEAGALFEARVAGGGVGKGDGGEVVAEGMAGDIFFLPTAIPRGLEREAGLFVEGGEETIGGELEQNFVVLREGLQERTIEEADVGDGDGTCGYREGPALG
jgi:hypothetical protein